uniref:Uncharacterized protein n=1 Tax=Anopheles minimus TaxID=112268 RepID=A0A182WNU7_9DIPT
MRQEGTGVLPTCQLRDHVRKRRETDVKRASHSNNIKQKGKQQTEQVSRSTEMANR